MRKQEQYLASIYSYMKLNGVKCSAIVYEDTHDLDHAMWHFAPHLSVGRARGTANMLTLIQELKSSWEPIRFRVDSVELIWRDAPPDDAFRLDRALPLQGR